jgi:hypothetical protein
MSKSTLELLSKARFLKIPPEAWDAIFPHGPRISQGLVELMTAEVIRDIAGKVKMPGVKTKLMSIGKGLAGFSERGLVQGWEDGDDICPPWPRPFPWPWSDVFEPIPEPWKGKLGPQPDPWRLGAIEQVILADLVLSLSGVTTSKEFSTQLAEVGVAMLKEASVAVTQEAQTATFSPRMTRQTRKAA